MRCPSPVLGTPGPGWEPRGEGPSDGLTVRESLETVRSSSALAQHTPDWLAPTSRVEGAIENRLRLWPLGGLPRPPLGPDSAPTSTPPAQALCLLRRNHADRQARRAAAPGRKQSQVRRAGPSPHTQAEAGRGLPCIMPGRSPAPSGSLLQHRGLQGLPRVLTPERTLTTPGPGERQRHSALSSTTHRDRGRQHSPESPRSLCSRRAAEIRTARGGSARGQPFKRGDSHLIRQKHTEKVKPNERKQDYVSN